MAFYNLWHPSLVSKDPVVLEFLLTLGMGAQMGRGTNEFVRQLLADLGIDAPMRKWDVLVCRSNYFCDYPDTEEWQDRWPGTWRFEVELDAQPVLPDPQPLGLWESDAHDASWTPELGVGLVGPAVCLVISDFVEAERLEQASKGIGARLREEGLDREASFLRASVLGTYSQLQVALGEFPEAFYAQDAPLARDLIAICAELGGRVNYRQIFEGLSD